MLDDPVLQVSQVLGTLQFWRAEVPLAWLEDWLGKVFPQNMDRPALGVDWLQVGIFF